MCFKVEYFAVFKENICKRNNKRTLRNGPFFLFNENLTKRGEGWMMQEWDLTRMNPSIGKARGKDAEW